MNKDKQLWVEDNPNESKFITYEGELPPFLYRYRSVSPSTIDRLINFEIIDEGIYLAAIKELNDPDEGRFIVKFDGTESEIEDFWRDLLKDAYTPGIQLNSEVKFRTRKILESNKFATKELADNIRYANEHIIRMACFTTEPVNYMMWANYARYINESNQSIDHGGICIEYICDESFRNTTLHPVIYTDEMPVINILRRIESDLVLASYKKTREWRGESEWRIVLVIQTNAPFAENYALNAKIRIENSIKSIIFGVKTPEAIIREVVTRVKAVRPEIKFKKVTRNNLTFSREIKNI